VILFSSAASLNFPFLDEQDFKNTQGKPIEIAFLGISLFHPTFNKENNG
jgi:hypothetical protein